MVQRNKETPKLVLSVKLSLKKKIKHSAPRWEAEQPVLQLDPVCCLAPGSIAENEVQDQHSPGWELPPESEFESD